MLSGDFASRPKIGIGSHRLPSLPSKPTTPTGKVYMGHEVSDVSDQSKTRKVGNLSTKVSDTKPDDMQTTVQSHAVVDYTVEIHKAMEKALKGIKTPELDRPVEAPTDKEKGSSTFLTMLKTAFRGSRSLVQTDRQAPKPAASPPIQKQDVAVSAAKPKSKEPAKATAKEVSRDIKAFLLNKTLPPEKKLAEIQKNPFLYKILKDDCKKWHTTAHMDTCKAIARFEKFETFQHLKEVCEVCEKIGFTKSDNPDGFTALQKLKQFIVTVPRGNPSSMKKEIGQIYNELAYELGNPTAHDYFSEVANSIGTENPIEKYKTEELSFKAAMEDPHLFQAMSDVFPEGTKDSFKIEFGFVPHLYSLSKTLNDKGDPAKGITGSTSEEIDECREKLKALSEEHMRVQKDDDVFDFSVGSKTYANITTEGKSKAPESLEVLKNPHATREDLMEAVNILLQERESRFHEYRNYFRNYSKM